MKPQFNHSLLSSFNLFLEHNLLKKGEAFSNVSGKLFPDSKSINDLNCYNSPNAQWVYDSSVGADVPSGVFVDGNFTGRSPDVSLDFVNGGAFLSGTGTGNVTAAYAKKDFNIYFQPELETLMLLERMFDGEVQYFELTGSNSHKVIAPCIIINSASNKNSPFAFGGFDETDCDIQATIITDNYFNLEGALSIFRDLNEKCFPVLSFEDIPWNAKGDLKNGHFDYIETSSNYSGNWSTVDKVISNNARSSNRGNNNFYVGHCEFKILSYRFPRQ